MGLRRASRFAARYRYAVAASLYLLTIGLLSPRHRGWLYKGIAHFGYQPVRTLIPTVPINTVLPPGCAVVIHEPYAGGGNVSLIELAVIAALIKQRQPACLLEIGTLDGRTTLNMAANAAPSAEIYTLDLPGAGSGARFRDQPLANRIVQLYGDSTRFDYSQLLGRVDYVFIDADHSYANVLSDSRQAVKLLRAGRGTIVWHDYDTWDWEGTTRALNDLYGEGGVFGGLRRIEGTSLVHLVSG